MTTQNGPDRAETELLLRSLSQVGPDKPIGYLPLRTIRRLAKVLPASVASDALDRGLVPAEFGPAECCIKSGALYVYHREALARLLRANTPILTATNLPLEPEGFVAFIAANWLEPNHPAYPVIVEAFGNTV